MKLTEELKIFEEQIKFVNKQMLEILEHKHDLQRRYNGWKDILRQLHKSKEKIEKELKNEQIYKLKNK